MHTKDLKTNYAPAAMVNWQEAGRRWPQPHPHAARLLRGLLWDQHYRHSNPQCEGGMPGSFELREDMGEDRLRAVEEWLRAEGYEYRFRRKRWRTWTRPDRPGEGLRPDGIEEDETPNEYPSGASINVSLWDMIEKNFPEPGSERRLQGSSSASPEKGKQSAGDRKRDRRWREYQESLAAQAAQGAKGGTPAPSPQRANGGHHPGHATLGDFMEVAKQTQAKPRRLLLRPQQAPAGPSSDVESAHRGRMPADQASSSSSAAPALRDVARACERVCGVPCNLQVARQRATQRNAAVEGAVGIAHEEATEWGRGMDYHASKVAAIAAGLTAAAAHEAVAAWIRATDEEARRTQERVKTEAELAALEAQKARLQQAREAEAARAREEAEVRAAAATAAAMEEAEAKLRRETPPGGSRVETLRKLFEGDASSRMTLDETDTGSSGSSGPTAHRRRKGKGKTPERPRRPAGGHHHDSDPFFTASDGDERGRRHRQMVAWPGGGGGDVPMEPEGEDEDLPPPYRSSESSETETPRWGDMDEDDDMDFGITKKRPSSDPPRRPAETHRDPLAEDHQDPLETPTKWTPWRRATGRGRTPWTGRTRRWPSWRTPWGPRRPTRGRRPGYHLAVDCLPPQESPVARAGGRHGQGRDGSHLQGRRARAEGAGHRQGRDQVADQRRQRPAAEAGRAGSPWELRQRPPAPGVWLVGRRLGTRTRSRQTPRPWRSPVELPQRQCPLSHRPLSPQRGPPQRARAARQWQ